jgi:phosphatidylserine decarboxylase
MSSPMIALQYVLPHHLLSRIVFSLTRCTWKPWKNLLVRWFIRAYGVDMQEAARPAPQDYESFNEFFTRPLRNGARPIDPAPGAFVSPVDGAVSQAGAIHSGTIMQAKGRSYTAAALLGGDAELAARFANGRFVTLYLAPHNYHRIHMPLDGHLLRMTCVPGRLFSVNEATTERVDGLFARNERVVLRFATGCGELILCLVGALFVGSMETVWHGPVRPASRRQPAVYDYSGAKHPPEFSKGAEVARFNMGSTVILLTERNAVTWDPELLPGAAVKTGRKIGTMRRTGKE